MFMYYELIVKVITVGWKKIECRQSGGVRRSDGSNFAPIAQDGEVVQTPIAQDGDAKQNALDAAVEKDVANPHNDSPMS